MTTLREEISNQLVKPFDKGLNDFKDFDEYQRYLHNVLINRMISIFVKLIVEKQNIKNLKPANKPEDVIYNCGVFDGLKGLIEELEK